MNIAELDSRLAATGTDVSQTLQDLKDQVGTNFSEITSSGLFLTAK